MTRAQVRRRLALAWWRQLALTLAPLFLFNLLFGAAFEHGVLSMPLFIAGMLNTPCSNAAPNSRLNRNRGARVSANWRHQARARRRRT